MKPRSKRLQPVRQAALEAEHQAVRNWQVRREEVATATRRLDELLTWEREYAQRMQGQECALRELQSYRLFMGQMSEAIEQQRQALKQMTRLERLAQEEWQARHSRQAALGKLIGRYQHDERLSMNRKEQQTLDEFALLMARPRKL